ncbi:MAG: hypothetical protein H6617_04080 [Bdellovibrionaceae bacterium]|nr:hypothetical protein [Bdellovibrionales bacterium]MCB9253837.1 hypothetical protein [Pseudobdellovibrionaceae bacterium]
MRHTHAGRLPTLLAIRNQIQVNNPRGIALTGSPTQIPLDFLEIVEDRRGLPFAFANDQRIEIKRVIHPPPRLSLVDPARLRSFQKLASKPTGRQRKKLESIAEITS